jgi:hypothetical protein
MEEIRYKKTMASEDHQQNYIQEHILESCQQVQLSPFMGKIYSERQPAQHGPGKTMQAILHT